MRKIHNHFCDSSIIELAQEHFKNPNKPLIIVCNSNEHAEHISSAITLATSADCTHIIPENETLPYDEEYPQSGLTSTRFKNINKLINSSSKGDVFLVPIRSLIERIANKEFYTPILTLNELKKLNNTELAEQLISAGYTQTNTVTKMGEFAINPNTTDLFAFGNEKPIRINSLNDITCLFNLETQLNDESVEHYDIYPTREFPCTESARKLFLTKYRAIFRTHLTDIYKDVRKGVLPRGIDYYKAMFIEQSGFLLNYAPDSAELIIATNLNQSVNNIYEHFTGRYTEISEHRHVLKPEDVLTTKDEILLALSHRETTHLNSATKESLGIEENNVRKQPKMHQTFKLVSQAHSKVDKTLITINSQTRLNQLSMMFNMKGEKFTEISSWEEFNTQTKGYFVLKADLDLGYVNTSKGYAVITEFEIFDSKTMEEIIYDSEAEHTYILSLNTNDPIVHAKYGVGRFDGFKRFENGGIEKEYIILNYAESSQIWVSLDELHLLSEYKGMNPEGVPLDNASSKHWDKNLQSAIKDVKNVAHELIKIKAQRMAKTRAPFEIPTYEYRKFANEFKFIPTRDQSIAIQNILKDLESEVAMDRLVVGDVGYGKTEIAMRAAMIVTHNKRQCSVIAPTTLLAEQHYQSFKERFESFGINIALLTRDSKSEEKLVLAGLESGEIDLVIGTHRLIQSDIKFKNLGLFIIDEEHRFGVKQKDIINKHRGNVDTLSLSATPIPRTLSMTMHGIREVSTVNTAPAKRLAIRTVAYDFDEAKIHEAISRELSREGQVFYLHNDTKTIGDAADMIAKMFPNTRVRYAHGKMGERELQTIMHDFRNHEFDVLVSTTIIETGIDVPNANTIILTDCDKLGLAQMHQLRGRVGRSNKQAYAYLLRPSNRKMSEIAEKRIEAMVSNNNLGGGFKISNADLEIRGAGEILGEEQSGHIQDIGYNMYFHLLEKAIYMIEHHEDLDDLYQSNNRLVFYVPASLNIPEDYISDSGLRAAYYKRIAEIKQDKDFESILIELNDRFGTVPEETKGLVELFQARNTLLNKGIRSTKIFNDTLTVAVNSESEQNQIIERLANDNITPILLNSTTFNVPFNKFNNEGLIDYVKLEQYF